MILIWAFLLGLGPALVVLFVVVRHLRATRERADQLGSRLAAVLDGVGASFSVWSNGRLVECNREFRELYAGVPLKPGVVWEDLIRFTATRGLVRVREEEVETWVREVVAKFQGPAREVLRMADGRWLEMQSVPTDHGETLMLFADVTELHDVRGTLSDASARLEQQASALVLLRRTIDIIGVAASFGGAVDQVVTAVCGWAGWPVGHAYCVSDDDTEQLESMRVWHTPTADTFASLRAVIEHEDPRKGEGVAGRAFQSGSILWIANLAVDPAISDTRREVMPGIRGACAVPIKNRGRVVAVLEFLSYDQLSPSTSATQLLEAVADALGWVFERRTLRTH